MLPPLPPARSVAVDPSQEELRRWALEGLHGIVETEFGNLDYPARILARLTPSTFYVADDPIAGRQTMSRAEATEWAARQDAHIAQRDMVHVRGYIGPDPEFRTGTQLFIERAHANIAAMQQQLYFPADDDWSPEFSVIYTPTLRAPEHHAECLILVDLEVGVTRVFGSDYFGESKMGSLRMWNLLVHRRGGLAMHSGAKTFPAGATSDGVERLALIIGLSGTGKTTTTFREVRGSLPVQDDFIALMPGGTVHATENGCFAKSFGLDPVDEPTIHGGATRPDAWLESVAVDAQGRVDFHDESRTANGRVTFPLSHIRHRDPKGLPRASHLFILNRNSDIIPAVARLTREQAATYFMLGETEGTAAGGEREAGKSLRVPGTNPFWFEEESSMGNRFLELLGTFEIEVFLLNTGRVGGPASDGRSRKVSITDSAAVQAGILDGTIDWVVDPDFGYEVAASVPGIEDVGLLQPRLLYDSQGRTEEYRRIVERLHRDRRAYLEGFAELDPRILAGLSG
ncbi:MAG: hypothetical protein RLZZ272_42 [Actinomycetota bacterium]